MGSRSAHRVFGSASTFQCPVLAEKTAAKPVGEIVCWKAGSSHSKAKVQSQPQHEGVESSRMQGKGLGDWGKDAKGSPGRRLIRFSAALPSVCTSHSIKNLWCLFSHSTGMAWASPQNLCLGNRVSEARAGFWGSGSFILNEW